ncbi:hypothetical protein [Gloeocapsopsis sp. IPPAS B-1203]|uniref:GumC family protein n=1 Tax=Gloeocapsopsis sp. IPPAS B-1203 TaxID=2049454 RepID=UPI000C19C67C|nr:hypothetical protein [Gloeocapsopsis sp. IPPAS B-1203]PIG95295.1 hypothetical protein CSQ79_02245 [Gloeocapsopsis sp. IPPAS B-1203]
MAESIRIPHRATRRQKLDWNGKNYLFLGLAVNAVLWTSAFTYLSTQQPTYTSSWTATLPGTESRTSVNLPQIGQTSTQVQSPYSNTSQDPRENYKFIAESEPVRLAAASLVNMTLEEFGKPRVERIANTTLVTFKVSGETPEEAQAKSYALHKALDARLRELRVQESTIQNTGFEAVLGTARKKLQESQQRLSDYKARSGLSANEQVTQLSSSIEQLRKEQANIASQQQQADARLQQLSANLGLSAQQATEAFSLQTDPYFQKALSDYGETSGIVADLSSRYTSENPALINQEAKRDAMEAALLARSQSLLGKPVSLGYVEQLSLNNSGARQQLFQQLVLVQADKQGLQAQAKEIEQQIAILDNRLKNLAQHQSVVDDLQRDVLISEAIFSSTLANLDLGGSDNLGSFPPIQVLTEPSLPQSPSAPNKQFILLGTTLGSLFLTAGLLSIFYRKHYSSLFKKAKSLRTREMPL